MMREKILVIRFGSLGDVILTAPVIQNLKIRFPDSHISFLTKARFAPVVDRFDGVDTVHAVDNDISAMQLSRLALKMKSEPYTTVIDLHRNVRSFLVRKLLRRKRSFVYDSRRRDRERIVKTKTIPDAYPNTVDRYNDVVLQLGGAAPCTRPFLTTDASSPAAQTVHRLKKQGPIVAFAPGAAHPTKQFPIERLAEIAGRLHRERNAAIIWAVIEADCGRVDLSSQIDRDKLVELVGSPINELADILAEADLAIANDSGIAHLSSAVGTPTIALFGPTHPALGFAPAGLRDRVIEVAESCRPCSLHGKTACYREERFCFTRIENDRALSAAHSILDETAELRPALFVDRDGTLIIEKDFLSDPEEVQLESGSVEALKRAAQAGLKIVIVSNQSGIARGYFNEGVVEAVNRRLLELLTHEGITVDGLYYCPHYPSGKVAEYAKSCSCRKPAPGMLETAALELHIDLRRSSIVGDKLDDLNLGKTTGCKAILVRTGHGKAAEARLQADGNYTICENLLEAVQAVEEMESR
jgi:D,D-heptose 1,7-bisphosphate phosphatase